VDFLRSARVVSLGTLVSRLLGLVRDVMTAALIGAGGAWDAFVLAYTVPNLLRRLLGEGALSSAFIPVFAEEREARGKAAAFHFFAVTLTGLALVLLGLAVLGTVATYVVPASWLGVGDEKGALTLDLIRVFQPYMLFVCLMAFLMGALNSLDHFLAPALAPALLNLCWIAGMVVAFPLVSDDPSTRVLVVAIAIVIGGALQLAVQIPPLRALGVRFRPSVDFKSPAFRRMLVTLLPIVVALAPVQINIAFDRIIAATMIEGDGANSHLFYGNRLMQLPLALIGVAMGVAVFPRLSRLAAARDDTNFAASVGTALRTTLFLAIPASIGLAVISGPVISLIYERQEFTRASAIITGDVLFHYAFGVAAVCALQVITRAFHSVRDTRTPVLVTAATVVLNLALNLLLVGSMRESGLALATSITAVVNVVVLLWLAGRRFPHFELGSIARSAGLSTIAGAACGGGAWLALRLDVPLLFRVLGAVAAGAIGFALTAIATRQPEWGLLRALLRRREDV